MATPEETARAAWDASPADHLIYQLNALSNSGRQRFWKLQKTYNLLPPTGSPTELSPAPAELKTGKAQITALRRTASDQREVIARQQLLVD